MTKFRIQTIIFERTVLLTILGACAILIHRNIGKAHVSTLDTEKTAALIPMPARRKSVLSGPVISSGGKKTNQGSDEGSVGDSDSGREPKNLTGTSSPAPFAAPERKSTIWGIDPGLVPRGVMESRRNSVVNTNHLVIPTGGCFIANVRFRWPECKI